MAEFFSFFNVLVCTIVTVAIFWLIVYFNGVTLTDSISPEQELSETTPAQIFLFGLTPLALASLIGTSRGSCVNSLLLLGITESIIITIFLLTCISKKSIPNLLGLKTLRRYQNPLLLAALWCIVFALWVTFAFQPLNAQQFDRVLVNSNPDMWFYLRRYAAFLGENITFDGDSACEYLLISPKKFSSFVGSLVIRFFPDLGLGITCIKGLLGCSIFLCLFGHWADFSKNKLGIIWALFSPQIYWLILSSYLSNTIFIIILTLGLRCSRNLSLRGKVNSLEFKLVALVLLICLHSFYFAGLPITLVLFLASTLIYSFDPSNLEKIIKEQLGLLLTIGLGILALYIFFQEQLYLDEVQAITDPFFKHGKNFVPLNPWSLLQEKPKPMGDRKDFGVWFNLSLGLVVSIFTAIKLRQKIKISQSPRDLVAALGGLLFYLSYLLAYIPLEHTYRLAKIAISFVWPLAIFGLFPLIKWIEADFLGSKPKSWPWVATALVVLHTVLHIHETFELHASYTGKYQVSSNIAAPTPSLTLVRCPSADTGRRYEVLAGYRLSRQYPQIPVHVIADTVASAKIAEDSHLIQGVVIPAQKNLDVCSYEVK